MTCCPATGSLESVGFEMPASHAVWAGRELQIQHRCRVLCCPHALLPACSAVPCNPSRTLCACLHRFPGDEIPIVRGSALAALKGENPKIGK